MCLTCLKRQFVSHCTQMHKYIQRRVTLPSINQNERNYYALWTVIYEVPGYADQAGS